MRRACDVIIADPGMLTEHVIRFSPSWSSIGKDVVDLQQAVNDCALSERNAALERVATGAEATAAIEAAAVEAAAAAGSENADSSLAVEFRSAWKTVSDNNLPAVLLGGVGVALAIAAACNAAQRRRSQRP